MGHTGRVQRDAAERVAEGLRAYGVIAHVAQPATFRYGIRVVLPDGREAVWDTDGAAGLEAQVLRDGVLVGFVPQVPGSEAFDEPRVIETIARTDYDSL